MNIRVMRACLTIVLVGCLSPPTLGWASLRILLLNDDGIAAEGIQTLKSRLEAAGHQLTVVAPKGDGSSSSASVNLGEEVFVEAFDAGEVPANEFAISRVTENSQAITPEPATPIECLLAAVSLLDQPPELIVSGINSQHNTGQATQLSGTAAGAFGGVSLLSPFGRVPSIAVNLEGIFFSDPYTPSADFEKVYGDAADFVVRLVARLESVAPRYGGKLLPDGVFLNVNHPARPKAEIQGVKLRRQGAAYLVRFDDGSGEFPIQAVRGTSQILSENPTTGDKQLLLLPDLIEPNEEVRRADTEALVNGWITITPMVGDYTTGIWPRLGVTKRLGNLRELLDPTTDVSQKDFFPFQK